MSPTSFSSSITISTTRTNTMYSTQGSHNPSILVEHSWRRPIRKTDNMKKCPCSKSKERFWQQRIQGVRSLPRARKILIQFVDAAASSPHVPSTPVSSPLSTHALPIFILFSLHLSTPSRPVILPSAQRPSGVFTTTALSRSQFQRLPTPPSRY